VSVRERLAAAPERASQINRALRNALDDADRLRDDSLSPSGLVARREQIRATAREQARRDMDELRRTLDADAAQVSASSALPGAGDDPATLQLMAVGWDRARLQLDAGATPRQVLATADRYVALALREWGGDWVRAQAHAAGNGVNDASRFTTGGPNPDVEHAIDTLRRDADDRLAHLLGGHAAEALADQRLAQAAQAQVAPYARLVHMEANGVRATAQDLMAAAVEASMASHEARSLGVSA